MRYVPLAMCLVATALFTALLFFGQVFGFIPLAVSAGLSALGIWDMRQHKHSLRRNYPILIRFALEEVRPEIRQYFLESDTDGTPFNRSKRAVAYQRAKDALDKRPFGTNLIFTGKISNGWPIRSRRPPSRIRLSGFRSVARIVDSPAICRC